MSIMQQIVGWMSYLINELGLRPYLEVIIIFQLTMYFYRRIFTQDD